VGTKQLFHGRVHTAVLGGVVVDRTGHADGRRARNEYQCDHPDCKGQFHGTPFWKIRDETGESGGMVKSVSDTSD
jgi:hypothetical protein